MLDDYADAVPGDDDTSAMLIDHACPATRWISSLLVQRMDRPDPEEFHSSARNTPFGGWRVPAALAASSARRPSAHQ